jgi:hypothetical protein
VSRIATSRDPFGKVLSETVLSAIESWQGFRHMNSYVKLPTTVCLLFAYADYADCPTYTVYPYVLAIILVE